MRVLATLAVTVSLGVPLAGHEQKGTGQPNPDAALRVGFGESDLTPPVGPKHKPVFIAGFGHNRKATGVHDPLMARAVVLHSGTQRIAIVSVDLVGLFQAPVERVRKRLPGFSHVLVSSTHNHEGPDTLGLWGPTAFQSGIDPDYLRLVEDKIVAAVESAVRTMTAAQARIGTARAPELVHDSREPQVKHDELVAVHFVEPRTRKTIGLVVQWNCHPETLDRHNTLLSADFVAGTIKHLQERHRCPVVYLTGTVGGLMTSLRVEVKDDKGVSLKDGTFEKTMRYGRLIGELADRALENSQAVRLTPLSVRSRPLFLPLDNDLYVLASKIGVLERPAYHWTGDLDKAVPVKEGEKPKRLCIRTELAWLRLGDLDVACVPGEIYPELVLDKVQDPPDPAADFPDAQGEPAIYKQLKGPQRMLVGLANDEIGYIIPKRQWDAKAPFCYDRKKAQYGEINSLGPETAPLLCSAFRDLVNK